MSPALPALKRFTQFSLASLLLFSIFCGALMGMWINRHEWIKAKKIPLEGTCNYLRFHKSKLLVTERVSEGIVGNVYDINSGALLYSREPEKSYGLVTVGRFENDGECAQVRSMPFGDFQISKEQCLEHNISAPEDSNVAAFKWDDLDFVQFSAQFDIRKKNISLYEPRGIFFKPHG